MTLILYLQSYTFFLSFSLERAHTHIQTHTHTRIVAYTCDTPVITTNMLTDTDKLTDAQKFTSCQPLNITPAMTVWLAFSSSATDSDVSSFCRIDARVL